jgi:tetratricopeptide (TPR) repeat protein
MKKFPIRRITAATLLTLSGIAAAVTEPEAAQQAREGHLEQAAESYAALVKQNPKSVALRLKLAETLAKDRRWERALAEYEAVLKLSPNNADALNGIGTVNRWRGHLDAARDGHTRGRQAAPGDPDGALGLAATEALDHDFGKAGALYDEAEKKWPNDGEVKQAAYDFRRQTNPRLFIFYEDDLSFRTESGGIGLPLFAREELEAEYQKETRFQYLTGAESYSRTDTKVKYTHFFGLNHTLEVDVRAAEYEYPTPPLPLPPAFSTAIDTFQEYRVRYTFPVTPEQRIAVRYSARPTTLLNTQEKFTAHKVEAELVSQWLPRFQTLIGTGWLRDLDSNAVNVDGLTSEALLKLGFQYDITNRLDFSARFITNPDLDSSVNSTTLVQSGYGFTDSLALLVRGRFDDYKTGDDQSAAYVAVRFTPSSHLWSEAGAKYVKRGSENGVYPLVSIVGKF